MTDLTYYGKEIAVLRSFSNGKYLVCTGESFHTGLFKNYKEFDDYPSALDYFHTLCN